MVGTPITYKGDDATIMIIDSGDTALSNSTLAISDFSLTISRGTAEQELVGEKGNFFLAGSRSIEGSLTACKLTTGAVADIVEDMIDGNAIQVSGNAGANGIHFYFKSAQITGFDFSIGTADEITEGSLDFTLLYPYMVSSVNISGTNKGTYITDFGNAAFGPAIFD